jgi:hypothetical protein
MFCGDVPDLHGRDRCKFLHDVRGWVLLYGRDERDAVLCGDIPHLDRRDGIFFVFHVSGWILLYGWDERNAVFCRNLPYLHGRNGVIELYCMSERIYLACRGYELELVRAYRNRQGGTVLRAHE